MINNIIKIKKKIIFSINFYNLIIKIGKQKKKFIKNKYLLKNCIVNTWVKIILKNKKNFFFGYSNSLFLSGIIKILFKIINKNTNKNIFIFFKFNFLLLLKINNKITNFKKETFQNIIDFVICFINNN